MRNSLFKGRPAALPGFRLRGEEVKRIETFSDGVFAFAVTLLIVSLEVPKSYEELLISMRGFLPFALCFTLLVSLWYNQHVFFRRYALDDKKTIFLNACLLFIVLFFVYPLKFLFTLLFSGLIYREGKNPFSIDGKDVPWLMVIYSLGYCLIYALFGLMYRHALQHRQELELNELEVFDTKTKIYSYVIQMGIGGGTILLAVAMPTKIAGLSGFFYILNWPALRIYYRRRAKMRERMAGGKK